MIPFDPPQATRIGLVAAVDNHLKLFIIGQDFQDNQFLINQYFHVMINPWMTTQKFFFQICDNYFLRSTGFYLICAVYGNVGRTDLDNRRIEHLW